MTLPLLHAITDDRVLGLPDFLDRARAVALGPAVALHLRTRADGAALLHAADRLLEAVAGSGARVIINDRVDVALLVGAYGVHLPAAGLPVAAARRVAPGLRVGRSAHHPAAAPDAGADWTFLGPIWPTASHPERAALGPEALEHARGVVAIGGVTAARAREAARHGAAGVAAITALWDAPDPGAAARALLLSFER